VQLQPLRGDHLLVQGLPEEGVGETVAYRPHLGAFLQHRELHGFLERLMKTLSSTASTALSVSKENSLPITDAVERRRLHSGLRSDMRLPMTS